MGLQPSPSTLVATIYAESYDQTYAYSYPLRKYLPVDLRSTTRRGAVLAPAFHFLGRPLDKLLMI